MYNTLFASANVFAKKRNSAAQYESIAGLKEKERGKQRKRERKRKCKKKKRDKKESLHTAQSGEKTEKTEQRPIHA